MKDKYSGYIRYVGAESPDLEKHDGGLRPAVGAWNVQVMRANRAHPEQADGVGNTYNHAPNLTWWNGRFYLAYLSNPVSEHTGAGQTFLCTSRDALDWTKPQVLFPPYELDLSLDNGPNQDRFEEGACACMHQRMNFFISSTGRLLAVGFYGIAPEVGTMPCRGYGVGRVAREIYADGSFGPIYFVLYSTRCGYDRDTCAYPYYKEAEDEGFVVAVDEMLADKLTVLQWWEENRDYLEEEAAVGALEDDFFAIRGAGEAFNWYALPDGRIVGLWKKSRASISEDGGRTWAKVRVSPSLVMSGGKQWGERLSDGRYALCYNPNTDSTHRWPLAIVTGEDGIEFRDMLAVHGEVPPQRYWGFWRDYGAHYIRGLEAGAQSPDGALYLAYSVNKEDIWVSRVPVPVTGRVERHVHDDFAGLEPRTFVPGWNAYSGVWSRVSLERRSRPDAPQNNALRLRCRDPYDYAAATRVFPESERVRLHARVKPCQNYFGCLEMDITDGRGACVFRTILDSDGTIKLKHGNGWTHAGTYGWGELSMTWEVDCIDRTVRFCLNGGRWEEWKFFNSAETVERIKFRTGRRRRGPWLDEDREFLPPDDLPGAGEELKQECVYYIEEFASEELL